MTSHAYEGDLFGSDGRPIHFSGRYRADFMTDRAQSFLRSPSAKSPFLLALSYLEVHHQNDRDTFDPPKEYAGRYPNPFIPPDLRPLPGSWPSQLSDYFACVAKMDEIMGTLRKTLTETGLEKNTILAFLSDHACHFKTRNSEYKRSPHESSIHIPLIVRTPGQQESRRIALTADQTSLPPTILELAGQPRPDWMRGQSLVQWLNRDGQGDGEGRAFCQFLEKNSLFKPLRHGTVGVIDGRSQYQYVLDLDTQKGSLRPLKEAQIWNLDRTADNPVLAKALRTAIYSRFPELVQKPT
jgi:membrane-anchored protein YejM (alkaline phosphatase superfamily)